ncbi:MAG: hypothetical protein EP346_01970 [Bacteroidetes bacterium]|nr:MAG: hypothetical protein EP346_01970 [Bacteroidota bacterium]
MSNLVFVLHPGIDERIVEILDQMEVKMVILDPSGDEDWAIGSHDAHWSCYGHSRVAGQVSHYLISKGLL